jgi:hypothetical protein
MYPRVLFNWMIPPLRPLEREILSAVEAKLDPQLAWTFREQRRRINYVQRRLAGREVGLYVMNGADRGPALPGTHREWRLAKVRLRKNGSELTASVYLVDGCLSSIEYDGFPPTGDHFVAEAEIFDPSAVETPRRAWVGPSLPDWLRALVERYGMSSIDPPLTEADRAAAVDRLECKLPEDYLEFLSVCDGVQIGALSLLGVAEAYDTRIEMDEYVVFGQIGGQGALAIRKPGPYIVLLNYEDQSVADLGATLRTALEQLRI